MAGPVARPYGRPMHRSVIVGVDGRDGGRDAIALASALTAERPLLVGVLPEERARLRGSLHGGDAELGAAAWRAIAACRDEAGLSAPIAFVHDTSPARALHRLAVDRDADLLVIGATHRGPVGRAPGGDVPGAVLDDAPCAVAVAPPGYRRGDRRPMSIGVAFDATPEAEAALRVAAKLVGRTGGRLVLHRVLPEDAPAEEREMAGDEAEAALRATGVRGAVRTATGDPAGVLAARSALDDLLVTGSCARGRLRHVAVGGTSARLLREAACPVVVAPRPAVDVFPPARRVQARAATPGRAASAAPARPPATPR